MTQPQLPWWLAEFYNGAELRDLPTRLLVQRTALLALAGALAIWTAGMQYTSAVDVIIAVGGFGAFLMSFPGIAQLGERVSLWWLTRSYPLEVTQR